MAQSNFYDDEDDSFWSRIFKLADEDVAPATPPPPPPPAENFNAQTYTAALIKRPLAAPTGDTADVPNLRDAANKKFVESGFYGDPAADNSAAPAAADTEGETRPVSRPPSWELPGTSTSRSTTILGDDTAFGPGVRPVPPVPNRSLADPIAQRETATFDGELRPPPSPPTPPEVPTLAPPSAGPAEPAAPIERPEAQIGLMLTAADSILRKAGEVASRAFGGSPELVKQAFDALGAVIKSALPPEHHASVDKSANAAVSEAQRRTDERTSADRNRAAIQTLTQRSAETAREHQDALISGDPAKAAVARREAVQAWRAERLARGDSPAEANAGARALDRRLRDDALQQRLTQADDAGMQRILETDPDAQRDPAAAQRRIDDIRRIRRDDPARAGQLWVESEIEKRKADGRIDRDEEETRTRAKLRWQAQAQRGIPEDQRRVFTNEERDAIRRQADEISDPTERARFIAARTDEADPLSDRATAELTRTLAPQKGVTVSQPAQSARKSAETDDGEIVPAQDKRIDPTLGVSAKTEAERRAEADAEYKANRDLDGATWPGPDWPAHLEELVRLAKKHSAVPSQFKKIAFGLLVIGETPSQRIAAARALTEIERLFPGSMTGIPEDHRRLVAEIDRLVETGQFDADPDALLAEAHRQIRLPQIPPLPEIAAGILGIRSTSIGHRRKRGLKAENLGAANLKDALERNGITVTRQVRYKTNEGDTIFDFVLKVGSGKRILRFIEHKTPKGSHYGEQKRRQESAAEAENVPLDVMRTAPSTGRSTVNGMSFEDYVKMLRREARRRR